MPEATLKIQLQAKTQKENPQADTTKVEGGHLCYSNKHHFEMLLSEKWHFQQKHLFPTNCLSNIRGAYQENVFEAEVWELKSLCSLLNLFTVFIQDLEHIAKCGWASGSSSAK